MSVDQTGVSAEVLRSISTSDRVETRLGTLEFVDGFPSPGTTKIMYDHLDFVHALNVFLNGYAGASTYALRKGFQEAGAKDNEILMFSELLGSESLFLTANADTVYFIGIVDLSSGPMVVETPPQALGMFDGRWWQWIVPGSRRARPVPARPAGLRPPAARQRVPHRALAHDESVLGRPALMVSDNPAPTVELIKRTTKIYPLCLGWLRHEHRHAAGRPGRLPVSSPQ